MSIQLPNEIWSIILKYKRKQHFTLITTHLTNILKFAIMKNDEHGWYEYHHNITPFYKVIFGYAETTQNIFLLRWTDTRTHRLDYRFEPIMALEQAYMYDEKSFYY